MRGAPCTVKALLQPFVLPARPNRADPRKLKVKPFIGFLYRVAREYRACDTVSCPFFKQVSGTKNQI
jgi:hypothetical protein